RSLTVCCRVCCCFFFSSRRRHTRFSRDWSSDVCSSDLGGECPEHPVGCGGCAASLLPRPLIYLPLSQEKPPLSPLRPTRGDGSRSEERRVGKECRSRGWQDHRKRKEHGKTNDAAVHRVE